MGRRFFKSNRYILRYLVFRRKANTTKKNLLTADGKNDFSYPHTVLSPDLDPTW